MCYNQRKIRDVIGAGVKVTLREIVLWVGEQLLRTVRLGDFCQEEVTDLKLQEEFMLCQVQKRPIQVILLLVFACCLVEFVWYC